MTCERCDEFRGRAQFCPYCGETLTEECGDCAGFRRSGAKYCGTCGRRFSVNEPAKETPILNRIAILSIPLTAIILILETIRLLLGTVNVWNWAAGAEVNILGLVPQLVVLTTIDGVQVQIAWILIEIAILLSLAILIIRSAKQAEDVSVEEIEKTPAWDTAAVFAMALAASYAIAFVMILSGVDIDSADVPTGIGPDSLFSYADAGVWEEVIARFVPMGVPMCIAGVLSKRKDSWRFLFGGFGFSRLSVVLIIVSAAMFGFAHMSGWGLWKVLPSFVTGLLLGYLYARVGIHATIAVHFAIDFTAVIGYAGEAEMIVTSLCLIGLLIAGIAVFALKAFKTADFVTSLKTMPNWIPPDREISFSKREKD